MFPRYSIFTFRELIYDVADGDDTLDNEDESNYDDLDLTSHFFARSTDIVMEWQ